MSLFSNATAPCPACGTVRKFALVASVNADRRPDLRAVVLDGSFQREKCAQCDNEFKPPPLMTYLDFARRNWILVQPFENQENWERFGEMAASSFALAYGTKAPVAAQVIGRDLRSRVVFGWSALREKLRCDDLKLDDVCLEMLKLSILRDVPDSPLSDDTELRLLGVRGPELFFAWVRGADERALSTLRVPREDYDALVAAREDWQPLHDELSSHPFVDINRMLLGVRHAAV